MEDNLLKFPAHKIVRENANIDVIDRAREKGIKLFADDIVDGILVDMMEHLNYSGLELVSEDNAKDVLYVAEAVRSMVYRAVQLPHEIQDVANASVLVEVPEDSSEGD